MGTTRSQASSVCLRRLQPHISLHLFALDIISTLILIPSDLYSPHLLHHWKPSPTNIGYVHSQWRLNRSCACSVVVCNSDNVLYVKELCGAHTNKRASFRWQHIWERKDELSLSHRRHVRKNSRKKVKCVPIDVLGVNIKDILELPRLC